MQRNLNERSPICSATQPEPRQGAVVSFTSNQHVLVGQIAQWSGDPRAPAIVVSSTGQVRRRFVAGLQFPGQMTLTESDAAAVRVTMQGILAKPQIQSRIMAASRKPTLLVWPPRSSVDPDEVPYVLVDCNRADGTGYRLSMSFDRYLTRSDRLKGRFCEVLFDLEGTKPRCHLIYCCEIGLIKQAATARWLGVHRSTVNIQLGRAQTWVNGAMGWHLPELADERDGLLAWARPTVVTYLTHVGAPVHELTRRVGSGSH